MAAELVHVSGQEIPSFVYYRATGSALLPPNSRTHSTDKTLLPSYRFFLGLFIYFEREKERELEQGRGRERGRQRIPSRLHMVSAEPNVGLKPMNSEIMT